GALGVQSRAFRRDAGAGSESPNRRLAGSSRLSKGRPVVQEQQYRIRWSAHWRCLVTRLKDIRSRRIRLAIWHPVHVPGDCNRREGTRLHAALQQHDRLERSHWHVGSLLNAVRLVRPHLFRILDQLSVANDYSIESPDGGCAAFGNGAQRGSFRSQYAEPRGARMEPDYTAGTS